MNIEQIRDKVRASLDRFPFALRGLSEAYKRDLVNHIADELFNDVIEPLQTAINDSYNAQNG